MPEIIMLPKTENTIPYGRVPLKIQGKKTRILGELATVVDSLMQEVDYSLFVEPFAGTGSVGCAMFAFFNMRDRRKSKTDSQNIIPFILADACEDFSVFYGAVMDMARHGFRGEPNGEEERRKFLTAVSSSMETMLHEANRFIGLNKNNYKLLRDDFNARKKDMPVFERAIIFLALNLMSFNGVVRYNKNGEFNVPFGKLIVDVKSIIYQEFLALADMFARFPEKSFSYLNLPYDKTITKTDRDGVLFYCDPPYLHRDTKYTSQWTQEDQEKFRSLMLGVDGSFIVSSWNDDHGSNNEELDKWKGCQFYGIPIQYIVGPKKENRPNLTEILIVRR